MLTPTFSIHISRAAIGFAPDCNEPGRQNPDDSTIWEKFNMLSPIYLVFLFLFVFIGVLAGTLTVYHAAKKTRDSGE